MAGMVSLIQPASNEILWEVNFGEFAILHSRLGEDDRALNQKGSPNWPQSSGAAGIRLLAQ